MKTKICSKCEKRKSLNKFNSNRSMKDGKDHYCQPCRSEAGMESVNRHKPGKSCNIFGCRNPHYAKDMCKFHYHRDWSRGTVEDVPTRLDNDRFAKIKYNYKVTKESYLDMAKNGCNVCGSFSGLSIDHDHSCCQLTPTCGGCTRGVVCRSCNQLIAKYENGIMRHKTLEREIINYVIKHER